MHSAFLYHGTQAGMDMAIVNAGQLGIYDEIPSELLERVEDALLNRRADATDRLVAFAETVKATGERKQQEETQQWREGSVQERLSHALVKGIDTWIEADAEEGAATLRQAHTGHRRPVDGRHEHRRRLVRRRQDVSAPGGEKRAGDEKSGGLVDAVYRGGKNRKAGGPKARSSWPR